MQIQSVLLAALLMRIFTCCSLFPRVSYKQRRVGNSEASLSHGVTSNCITELKLLPILSCQALSLVLLQGYINIRRLKLQTEGLVSNSQLHNSRRLEANVRIHTQIKQNVNGVYPSQHMITKRTPLYTPNLMNKSYPNSIQVLDR